MSAARRDLPPPPFRVGLLRCCARLPWTHCVPSTASTYLPHQRANVDQVPLPFVNDMETTYEEVGAKRVCINQQGPTLGKRQATGQVCFRPALPPAPEDSEALAKYKQHLMQQPAPCIIFRGTGQRISQAQRRQRTLGNPGQL